MMMLSIKCKLSTALKKQRKLSLNLAKKGYVGVLMLSWKWGKRMIYYVKRYATPRMSKDKAEKAKWMKGKYFRNPKRYSQ
jgi:hypothetical protein